MSQASEHDADHGDGDPGFFTGRKHFVVFGEPAPGGQPGKRALHDPAPFEDMEATGPDFLPIDHGILGCPDPSQAAPGMLHDLHIPAQRRFDPLDEAALLVRTIGPNELEPREATLERPEQLFATVMILDIGLMHQHAHDQPGGIHEQMPLAPFHALAAIVAAPPPFWLVFTDWLSMMVALGVASRPCFTRTASRSAVCIRFQVPLLRHVRK